MAAAERWMCSLPSWKDGDGDATKILASLPRSSPANASRARSNYIRTVKSFELAGEQAATDPNTQRGRERAFRLPVRTTLAIPSCRCYVHSVYSVSDRSDVPRPPRGVIRSVTSSWTYKIKQNAVRSRPSNRLSVLLCSNCVQVAIPVNPILDRLRHLFDY